MTEGIEASQATAGAEAAGTRISSAGAEAAEVLDPRRFVICGDTPLAYRLARELTARYDGEVAAIVPARRGNWAPRIGRLPGVTLIVADPLDAEAFERAGLADAAAAALVAQDDGGNVDAALIAQEINPNLRIVIRMFNLGLGENIAALLNDCVVLSAAAIAAPALVAAALDDATTAPVTVADRTLVATRRDRVAAGDVVCGLAITGGRAEPETLPPAAEEADVVLARSQPAPARRAHRRRSAWRTVSMVVGTRLRLALAALIAVLLTGTAVLAWVKQVTLPQAGYIAFLTELGGADADPNAPGLEKLTLAMLSVVSIALIPLLTAAVVDAVVKARLTLAHGGLVDPVADHVVVVGLGDVGSRVIRNLHEQGLDVVCVERNPEARGLPVARELGIPVVIGDASHPEVLQAASVSTSRALLVVSTDDVTNLETALLGRAARPDLRVVLRLFDGEFANRVQRAFAIAGSRSVSYLAAPAFAAAMLGRQVITTIAVRRHVLLVAELPIAAGAVLDGARTSAIQRPHEASLLALRVGDGGPVLWSPPPGRVLAGTDRVVVVATRAGLGRLLAETAAPASPDGVPPRHPAGPIPARRLPANPIGPVALTGSASADGPDG